MDTGISGFDDFSRTFYTEIIIIVLVVAVVIIVQLGQGTADCFVGFPVVT